jgi:hypothetical protein
MQHFIISGLVWGLGWGWASILASCETIQNKPHISEKVCQNMMHHCSPCNEASHHHFEQLLWIIKNNIIKNSIHNVKPISIYKCEIKKKGLLSKVSVHTLPTFSAAVPTQIGMKKMLLTTCSLSKITPYYCPPPSPSTTHDSL